MLSKISTSSKENFELSNDSLNNEFYHTSGAPAGVIAMQPGQQMDSQPMVHPMTSKTVELTPDQKAEEMIRQAEAAKAKIFPTTGENEAFYSIAKIDQDYQ